MITSWSDYMENASANTKRAVIFTKAINTSKMQLEYKMKQELANLKKVFFHLSVTKLQFYTLAVPNGNVLNHFELHYPEIPPGDISKLHIVCSCLPTFGIQPVLESLLPALR